MVDTNILISALLFPQSRISRVLEDIAARHVLVLATFVINELWAVVERKFPDRTKAIDHLLNSMRYELVYTPNSIDRSLFEIRDAKDYPVLYTAMTSGVDILVTGDKDFAGVEVDAPQIMTPAQYAEAYL